MGNRPNRCAARANQERAGQVWQKTKTSWADDKTYVSPWSREFFAVAKWSRTAGVLCGAAAAVVYGVAGNNPVVRGLCLAGGALITAATVLGFAPNILWMMVHGAQGLPVAAFY